MQLTRHTDQDDSSSTSSGANSAPSASEFIEESILDTENIGKVTSVDYEVGDEDEDDEENL